VIGYCFGARECINGERGCDQPKYTSWNDRLIRDEKEHDEHPKTIEAGMTEK
jgi:hypothetical protein